MRWESPIWLFALWVLPPLAAVLFYAHRRRAAAARRFADAVMLSRLLPPSGARRAWVKGGMLIVGVALLIVAAARPRFGVYFEHVSARGVDLFVLLDVSRSMLAEDVAPNRLERAKSDIRDLLARLSGDRVGLIAFAGAPAVVVPLTSDHGFFLNALEAVDTNTAPRGGSLIGDAIRKAVESLDVTRDRDQVLVLITDGEDQDSFPLEAAESAAERQIKIFTVGLGDVTEGRRIPIRDDTNQVRYLKHEGQEIWSRMDERLLKEIALKTSGAYIPARTRAYDLGKIYEQHLAGLTRGEIQAEKRKRYAERFQWFVFLALIALLGEMLVSPYPRVPRAARSRRAGNDKDNDRDNDKDNGADARTDAYRTEDALRAGDRQKSRDHAISPPAGNARNVGRVALLAGLLFGGLIPSGPATGSTGEAARRVTAGVREFARGQYAEAARHFAEADVALPDDPRIAYDQACAWAASGDADKAVELFQRAALGRDQQIAAASHYNLGGLAAAKARTLFGAQPESAAPETREQGLHLLGQAVAHYRDCLRVQPEHADARHNLELLRQWIKYMQQAWAERDRQQRHKDMNLLQMLERITTEQTTLRRAVQAVAHQDDSPTRRQAASAARQQQRELADEIELLKDKIRETLAQPAPPAPGTPAPGAPTAPPQTAAADVEHAIDLLHGLADRAHESMDQAARDLAKQDLVAAGGAQQAALDSLEDIYLAVAPFPLLVTTTMARQQKLVARAKRAIDDTGKADEDAGEQDTSETAPPAAKTAAQPDEQADRASDLSAQAHEQTLIRRRGEVLPRRAEQELKQLPPPVAGPAPPPGKSSSGDAASTAAPADLRPALQKAVEVGPQIAPLAQQAAEDLEKARPGDALPRQEQTLELLRQIADLLPKQPQQDQQQDEQQDQQSQEQQSQDQQSQNQQPNEQQEDRSDDQQDQQSAPQAADGKRETSEMTRQQAESLMRQIRERDRQHREKQQQLRQFRRGGVAVDKDW